MPRTDEKQKPIFYQRFLTDEDVLLVFPNTLTWLSRRQIAELVWRSVTPDFRQRLERLAGEGKLEKTIEVLPNGRDMFWYRKVI